jgi:hypothetical protein
MFETYRMLGREREAELESEAERLRPLAGRPINRIAIVIIAVCLAAVAFGATVARAGVALPGSTSGRSSAPAPYPNLIERWVASHKAYVLAPDDRIRVRPEASNQGAKPSTQVAYPDLVEPSVASHQVYALAPDDGIRVRPEASSNQVSSPASSAKSGDGFDWAAAGVGASTIATLLLVFVVGAYGLRVRARSVSA